MLGTFPVFAHKGISFHSGRSLFRVEYRRQAYALSMNSPFLPLPPSLVPSRCPHAHARYNYVRNYAYTVEETRVGIRRTERKRGSDNVRLGRVVPCTQGEEVEGSRNRRMVRVERIEASRASNTRYGVVRGCTGVPLKRILAARRAYFPSLLEIG